MASSLKTQPSMDVSEISVDIHTLPPDLSEWVINMDAAANKIDLCKEEADWKKPSIYRVTHFARRHNPNAFTPQVISFGPFHHGSEPLQATKQAKQRALAHFLNRARKPSEHFVSRLQSIFKQLQDSYQGLDEKWKENPNEFLKMMLLDGCFMIKVLRLNERSNDYATNDHVFSSRVEPLHKPYIKRDMLLLENQLPLLVLKALLEVENIRQTDDEYINSLVLSYCGKNLKADLSRLASHPLELYRVSLLHEAPISGVKSPRIKETNLIENAVKLWESGVRFKCKDIDFASLRDINFDPSTGTLELPVLPVHDGTEHLLLNMVAYEQIHGSTGNEITSYVMFMEELINTADDVQLLQRKNIIINSLGSYKYVADLFNNLSKEAAYNALNDVLNNLRLQLSKYYEKRRNTWQTTLRYHYFHNPWRVISIGWVLFVFFSCTFVQTLCSLVQTLPSQKMT